MSTRLLERWSYSNTVPPGEAYVDTDDLFLFVRTTSSTVRLDHPVYHVSALGSPDFYINMNDGTCLAISVEEDPKPSVDKVLFRIPKNSVRFELKEINDQTSLNVPDLLTNALKYNGSYTASSTGVQGKWGFYLSNNRGQLVFSYFNESYDGNCYIFDEFRPFVMYYNGLYMICYDRTVFTRKTVIN